MRVAHFTYLITKEGLLKIFVNIFKQLFFLLPKIETLYFKLIFVQPL